MLAKFYILHSVVQQAEHHVIPDKVRDIGYDAQIFLKSTFPWNMISPTIQTLCSHYGELLARTNRFPVAMYSEQASEGCNKLVRNDKSGGLCRARQMSQGCLHDTSL